MCTYHQTTNYISTTKTVANLHFVFLCGSDILCANDARELFAWGQWYAIHDRY